VQDSERLNERAIAEVKTELIEGGVTEIGDALAEELLDSLAAARAGDAFRDRVTDAAKLGIDEQGASAAEAVRGGLAIRPRDGLAVARRQRLHASLRENHQKLELGAAVGVDTERRPNVVHFDGAVAILAIEVAAEEHEVETELPGGLLKLCLLYTSPSPRD